MVLLRVAARVSGFSVCPCAVGSRVVWVYVRFQVAIGAYSLHQDDAAEFNEDVVSLPSSGFLLPAS